jgi:hypothetical protein
MLASRHSSFISNINLADHAAPVGGEGLDLMNGPVVIVFPDEWSFHRPGAATPAATLR